MRTLFFLFNCLPFCMQAQAILVQPYLQDAEPQSIIVRWETNGGTTHTVEWGIGQANLNNSATAISNTISGSNLVHEATISGLTANTRYYYKVVSDNEESAIFDFITPPLKSSDQPFNIIAMSDMQKDGSNPNKFQELIQDGVIPYVQQQLGNDLPANLGFVMIPGDLVVTGTNYSQWQNDFFGPSHPLFAQVPVYPVLGNHENNSSFYFQYFSLPGNGTAGFEEHWWYKDYSNVRIIGLNSNAGFRVQSQLDWLDAVLDDACVDNDIDFVFAQLHHPHKSELWTPGEISYTGDVIELMETFTSACAKPSIHFFGHTHGYSRGQSRDYEHLWVNVATAGGAIDYWGAFPNADYEEFNKTIDEYGFVVVNVEAGSTPQFTLKRISRGDETTTLNNVEQDLITLKAIENAPQQPIGFFPNGIGTVNPNCFILVGSPFVDVGDFHQASHWQIAETCGDFSSPVVESWKQHENWYNEVDTQAGDVLTDEEVGGLLENTDYCWRVRYRDEHLKWSDWSAAIAFQTGATALTENLLLNPGGESGVVNWTIETGIIESLGAGECNGVNPNSGERYFAVGGLCDGNETPYSEVYQEIDVSGLAALIDGGSVETVFGGFLSDYSGSDQPTMNLEYLDAGATVLGTSEILTTFSSTWVNLVATELIPINTRTLKVILTGTRNAGTDNDSYFDDLSVQLDTIPGSSCTTMPLPVELTHFSVECEGEEAFLTWKVETEQNISFYQIERSEDGQEWIIVGSESPRNSGNSETYIFKNGENIIGKTVFYRLEVFEMDGTSTYSSILSANCENLAPVVQVFPNPISEDYLKLFLEQSKASLTKIQVVNVLGQIVYENKFQLERGANQFEIENINWASGIYTITLTTTEWEWTSKLFLG